MGERQGPGGLSSPAAVVEAADRRLPIARAQKPACPEKSEVLERAGTRGPAPAAGWRAPRPRPSLRADPRRGAKDPRRHVGREVSALGQEPHPETEAAGGGQLRRRRGALAPNAAPKPELENALTHQHFRFRPRGNERALGDSIREKCLLALGSWVRGPSRWETRALSLCRGVSDQMFGAPTSGAAGTWSRGRWTWERRDEGNAEVERLSVRVQQV